MSTAPTEIIQLYPEEMDDVAYSVRRKILPHPAIPGRPLGRHVNHDSRSKMYRPQAATPSSVAWQRRSPILDQIGSSCTGNAAAGALGTDPFYDALRAVPDETLAMSIYGQATMIDPYPGQMPDQDTGSDGLSVAKICVNMGLISGYVHALSMDEFLSGMQKGPAIVGTGWGAGQDDCDPETGMVVYTGADRGGHEYEAAEVDMTEEIVWCWNSWGLSWGKHNTGKFGYRFSEFEKALADDGDATFFVPLTEPAPRPTPVPEKITKSFTSEQAAALDSWAQSPHIWRRSTAASKAWKAAT